MESMRGTVHTVLSSAMEGGGIEGGETIHANVHTVTHSYTITARGWKGKRTTQERDRGFNKHAVHQPCLPIRLSLLLSLLLLLAVKWNSFPQQTPVPGSSRQAVLVASLLRLYRIIIAVYVIYQRHCANRSAKRQHHNTMATLCCAADSRNRPQSNDEVRFHHFRSDHILKVTHVMVVEWGFRPLQCTLKQSCVDFK